MRLGVLLSDIAVQKTCCNMQIFEQNHIWSSRSAIQRANSKDINTPSWLVSICAFVWPRQSHENRHIDWLFRCGISSLEVLHITQTQNPDIYIYQITIRPYERVWQRTKVPDREMSRLEHCLDLPAAYWLVGQIMEVRLVPGTAINIWHVSEQEWKKSMLNSSHSHMAR